MQILAGKSESDLEKRVIDRINSLYLIERKSSEIFNGEGTLPITATQEVKYIAGQFLRNNGIDITRDGETAGWDKFWAQEMAAAMAAIAASGGTYQAYLPGRFLHYDLLAYNLLSLFNNHSGTSIEGKAILESGSGSGLSLVRLAQKGALVTGLDWSIMALQFSEYLAGHYMVSDKVNLVHGDYFNAEFDDGAFDIVYNAGVFEHLNGHHPDELLREMIRITKHGGYIVIAIPNEDSPFYKRFKQKELATKKDFSGLVGIPVEHSRYHLDLRKIMEDASLHIIKEDGLQVAPSSPLQTGDIAKTDLEIFETYLPKDKTLGVESKIAIWRGLELINSSDFRIRYGWSRYCVGQKAA